MEHRHQRWGLAHLLQQESVYVRLPPALFTIPTLANAHNVESIQHDPLHVLVQDHANPGEHAQCGQRQIHQGGGDHRPHIVHHQRTGCRALMIWIPCQINNARKVNDLALQGLSGPASGHCSPALAAVIPPCPPDCCGKPALCQWVHLELAPPPAAQGGGNRNRNGGRGTMADLGASPQQLLSR